MTSLYQCDDMGALATLSMTRQNLKADIESNAEKIEAFAESVKGGMYPGFSIVNHEEDLASLTVLAEDWKERFKHIVFLGVGGSSLGAQTLAEFTGRFKKHKPALYFVDNVDPHSVDDLLHNLNLEKTMVVAVSKSGGTIETVMQSILFAQAFDSKGLALKDHMLGITEDKDSPLKAFLDEYEVPFLTHSKEVGGRFTVFTLVGLLPALMAGVDVHALRAGAAEVLNNFYDNPIGSEATYGAALSVKMGEMSRPMQYMMPYSDRLAKLSEWYVQLWAESLGKEGLGTTPIPAKGSTDQHSALQMLMDGPKDKMVTLLVPNCSTEGEQVSERYAELVDQPHLNGLSLGKLIYNQALGTAEALASQGVPVRVFYTEPLSEKVLGGLLMHFMLETAIGGILLDVNTWNQPGVEDGKVRTMAYLQKSNSSL